uniref:Alpha-2-macroglobulin-like n=1 Tax=Sphaeramia orbicularis TaxID=375764 RepID=A0A672YEJ6_9TELE
MDGPGQWFWTWTLVLVLRWICLDGASTGPRFLVPVPAYLEAGSEQQFCVSLLQPNETLDVSVSLESGDRKSLLLRRISDTDFHTCTRFQVPSLEKEEVQNFVVEVSGETFHSKQVTKVKIRQQQTETFIQTDKPIYLPGQTVHFRVVTLDSHLRPAFRKVSLFYPDPHNNRIGQWLDETTQSQILQRFYTLNSEAREGTYTITVVSGHKKKYHNFRVEKYVLPKFEVKINTSAEVSIDQEEVTAEICATYTFGQPVPASVKVDMCRPLRTRLSVPDDLEVTAPCFKETKQTDERGCTVVTVPMSTFTRLDQKVLNDDLELTAKVEEEGTGVKRIGISYVVGRLAFVDTPTIYEQGSNLEGKVRAVYYNNTPIPDSPVYLFDGDRWSRQLLQNLTTDVNGIATFRLNMSKYSGNAHLHVSDFKLPSPQFSTYRVPYFEPADITISMAQESSVDDHTVSFLKVKKTDRTWSCDTEDQLSIQFTVVKEQPSPMALMYLVLSRQGIITQGQTTVQVQPSSVTEGEVSFTLKVLPEMAPKFEVVAYAVLPSGFVIADKATFSTEKCFSHNVSLEFSPSLSVPGEENILHLTANPGSLCGISAVDQSVLIKAPGKTLTADKIFDLFSTSRYISRDVQDPAECLVVRPKRHIAPYPSGKDDPFTIFQNLGLKMATNLVIRTPECLKYMGHEYSRHPAVVAYGQCLCLSGNTFAMEGHFDSPPPPPVETIRTFFPETWIWDLVEVGVSGRRDMSVPVPDTITTWQSEVFCLSQTQGFGLAPPTQLRVFQPFFLELRLPYSIIRGENFQLKATVFNYLDSCFKVTVTPTPSADYTLTPLSGDQYSSCLCGKERRTFSWTMDASALGSVNVSVTAEASGSDVSCTNEVDFPDRGRIDTVTKSVLVKAEGVEMSDVHNLLLCPKGGSLTAEVQVELPQNVIHGSARASVSVLGDILGRALQNPDGLLKMPYGCGEQNIALMAPNVYILQYLNNTQQLSPGVREKASTFLSSGYQRQLNYRHEDGAYSTFGTGRGNTWLTAFVMRTFVKAQSFVYIDLAKIQESKECVNAAVGSMLKSDAAVNRSLSCLRDSMSDLRNTYTTALMAYVFTLAGDMDTRAQLLDHLDKAGQGGFLHWAQTSEDSSLSLSVEISSYVLLAKLSASPTDEDLGYSARIVRWLTQQQNHYGGFSSTQDTVVALQALALYSTLVFSPDGSSSVTVQSPSGQMVFDVNQNNRLLYQEGALQDATGKYGVEVTGTACASVQVSVHYNIPPPKAASTLSVEVEPQANCDVSTQRPKLTLTTKSLYSGEHNVTNMVILDFKILSGFVPDPESLKALRGAVLVDRVEHNNDHVLVYLQEVR